jgi:pimeloyl-ACP methyl ester carboxylesterase
MRRSARRILIGSCMGLIVAVVTGATYQWIETRRELAATPPPGRMVDLGGHRLHLWCVGAGGPTVVLESGLGGTTADWGFVQPEVATFTRACSYDRGGMGYSDSGPTPRTARRIARELVELLNRSGVRGPVVLVGASLGGFYVRLFASEYPGRAAGLVLVDATLEDHLDDVPWLARFVPFLSATGVLRVSGVSFGLAPRALAPAVRPFARATQFRSAGHQAAANEILHVRESAAEVTATRRKLTVPVVVVTAGRGTDRMWRDLQSSQARLSQHGCQMTAAESGHVVPIEEPGTVVRAIRAIVAAVRSGADTATCD